MWQLTMYCHPRKPDMMPLLTKNLFGVPERQRPNFDVFIYIHYAAPPKSASTSGIYPLPFGEV